MLYQLSYVGAAVDCTGALPSARVQGPLVEQLDVSELRLVKPLLVDLYLSEQEHYAEMPQLERSDFERIQAEVEPRFVGENIVLAVRDGEGGLAGFCWLILFDPGTGLEGEVAEVYVAPEHRARGVARALLAEAVALFKNRGVTLGYVWTRADNGGAVRLYRGAGFADNRQLVLTWYPTAADAEAEGS